MIKPTNAEVRELGALIARCNDQQLDYLVRRVVSRRRQLVDERALGALEAAEVGKTVRINNIKPLYLKGERGIIRDIDGDRILVELLTPSTRALRRYGGMLRVPASCCTVLD